MGHSLVIVNLDTGMSHSLMVLPTCMKKVLPVILVTIALHILITVIRQIMRKRKKAATSNRTLETNSGRPFNTECPICIVRWTYGVRTNCNHAFCLECLHKSFQTNGLDCPVCRVRVTRLQSIFGDEDILAEPVARRVEDGGSLGRWARMWRRVDPVLVTTALLLLMLQCALDGIFSALPLLVLLAVRTMLPASR